MYVIQFTSLHSLPMDVARERMADFGETLELLSQARSCWQGREALSVRGPNVDGMILIKETHFEVRFRLGITLSVIGEAMAVTLMKELRALSQPVPEAGMGPVLPDEE